MNRSFTLKLKNSFLLLTLAIFTLFTACVDQDFDIPPAPEVGEQFKNTIGIEELKTRHTIGETPTQITEDIAIKGIVIADDLSGNFFKQIVIQDETGGINIQINATGLYNQYPVGREIFVNCNGLYIGDFAGTLQLGGSYDEERDRMNRIDEVLLEEYIALGADRGLPTAKKLSLSELNEANINTLVEIEGLQFQNVAEGQTYADFDNRNTISAVNHTLQDCDGNQITLRSSSYADFADFETPMGNGTITAVYSVFSTTQQLFIRNSADVAFENERCDGTGGGSGDENLVTIGSLRQLYTGSATNAPADAKIQGIVISDRTSENITNRNLILQGEDGKGIVVRYSEPHEFNLGEELEVIVSNQELSEFNGLLQVNNIGLANSRVLSSNNTVEPKTVTIAEILNNFEDLESSLVKIEDVTISKDNGNDFAFATTLTDATGSIVLFTTSFSSFANESFPTNSVTITAIVTQGGNDQTQQVALRNLTDIEGGETGGGEGDALLAVDFEDQTDFEDISIENWQNVSMKGGETRKWIARSFSGNVFAHASAFEDDNPEVDTWLITPALDRSKISSLQFESSTAFHRHDGLSVLVSIDYDGSNVESATWKPLDATLAGSEQENYVWVDSGVISLEEYTGKIHIAFRYQGTAGENTSTYRIDNVRFR